MMIVNDFRPLLALRIVCPRCNALVGAQCYKATHGRVAGTDKLRVHPHDSRQRAASIALLSGKLKR